MQCTGAPIEQPLQAPAINGHVHFVIGIAYGKTRVQSRTKWLLLQATTCSHYC
jgi:hypothetical protein